MLVSHGAAALRESLSEALQSFPKGGLSIRECIASFVGLIGSRRPGQPHKRIETLQEEVRKLALKEERGMHAFWPAGGSLQKLLECSAAIIRAKESAQGNNFQITV